MKEAIPLAMWVAMLGPVVVFLMPTVRAALAWAGIWFLMLLGALYLTVW